MRWPGVRVIMVIALAAFCLFAPPVSIAKTACDEESRIFSPVLKHFSQDISAWAESNLAIESYSLDCDDSQLTLQAVARGRTKLTFSPTLDVLAEPRRFYGLAAYYNQLRDFETATDDTSWRGWKGRFAAALVRREEGRVEVSDNTIELTPGAGGDVVMQLGLIESDGRGAFGGIGSRNLRYTHLWGWLRALSLFLEDVLTGIQSVTKLSWGSSIILLCVLIKVALIPVSIYVARQQRRVGRIQSALERPLREIKASYDGQEAHERIIAAHKDLGVSPFYTLKPMLGMFIQVPVLVAVFNMLGELPHLSGQAFWWISDLAYPDAVLQFIGSGTAVPLFGNTLNLLPILMTVVTIASAVIYRDHVAPATQTRKQKRNLYLMAFAFFVLFYPFPASMVLYWATANVLQVIQQVLKKE